MNIDGGGGGRGGVVVVEEVVVAVVVVEMGSLDEPLRIEDFYTTFYRPTDRRTDPPNEVRESI